jgi:hypothetical protein
MRRQLHFVDRSAADEVHNLDSIAFIQNRLRPFATASHISIQLNGDTHGRQRQFTNQIFQARAVWHFLIFSVYLNAQDCLRGFRFWKAG